MAVKVKLFEHHDFRDIVTATAESLGKPEAFVEKDYFITELLRLVANRYPDGQMVFKGGTSLSKAWRLIDRLSEDVDLLLASEQFEPKLSRKRIDFELAQTTQAVAEYVAFNWAHVRRKRGFSRSDRFQFEQHFPRPGIAAEILIESGVRGGTIPTVTREIESEIGRFLRDNDHAHIADDTQPFTIKVLHFRRTFVEKLFAVHGLVHCLRHDGIRLGRNARHYIDLHALAGTPEVRKMLNTTEYQALRDDVHAVSERHFPKQHVAPSGLDFSNSEGLFPDESLVGLIRSDYEEQCETLCFGGYPSFDDVTRRLKELQPAL